MMWRKPEPKLRESFGTPAEQESRRAKVTEWERDRDEAAARLKVEETPILEDLRRVGCDVEFVWDLVGKRSKFPQVVPVLLKHLVKPYSVVVKAGIARALSVPGARVGWHVLLNEYRTAIGDANRLYREGLADAIATAARPGDLAEVIELLHNRSLGDSRVLLLSVLRRSKQPKAKETLRDLASDPDLSIQIAAYSHSDELRERRAKQ